MRLWGKRRLKKDIKNKYKLSDGSYYYPTDKMKSLAGQEVEIIGETSFAANGITNIFYCVYEDYNKKANDWYHYLDKMFEKYDSL